MRAIGGMEFSFALGLVWEVTRGERIIENLSCERTTKREIAIFIRY